MYTTQGVLLLLVLYVGLVHSFSWDIVVTRSNNTLEFYNKGTLSHTATPESHIIKWITYDPVHDRVLFIEKYNREDAVSSFNIASQTTQSLIKKIRNRNLKRYAYDPATELLFGTDLTNIYSFPLRTGNKNEVNGNLVISLETMSREVAVDSCGGYIYWISYNNIERALFNGLEREIIIDKTDNLTIRQGLAVDGQKIYWIETQKYNDGVFSIESADLDGNNRKTLHSETDSDWSPDKLTLSKDFISWGDSIEKFFWQLPKTPSNDKDIKPIPYSINCYFIALNTKISTCGSHDIAANYKIEERTQSVPNCNALLSRLPAVGPKPSENCVLATEANGETLCYCKKGFFGERCDVSLCRNYCFQGNCSISADGDPQCRCYAGYSGKRCDANPCHNYCLNNGVCSLNTKDEPVCQCLAIFKGERCEQQGDGFVWVPMVDDKLPPGAVVGGIENGKEIYVARAFFNGWMNPGKYVKATNTASIPLGGEELIMKKFEILCGFDIKWVKTDFNNIPKNAVHAGSPGDPVYICRNKKENNQDIICGKAHGRFKNCYLPYHGKEIIVSPSELLVEEKAKQ